MKLSIIIVNYNTKEITLKCLKSIEKYPLDQKFEVILIDNNSQDGSKDVFGKFKSKKYKFSYIFKNKNLGFSKANNIGIKKSKGQYVLLLNSDTMVLKDSLNKFLNQSEKLENAGVVGCKLLNADKSVQASVFKLPSLYRVFNQYILNRGNILDKYYPKSTKAVEVESVVGAAFLMTPSAIEKVGLLNEKYFMYFEDLDYCRQTRKTGLKVYYLPDVKIVHYHGASKGDWHKLVESSKIYHGVFTHYIIFFLTWFGQQLRKTNY